jgi:hypothetical protein
MYPRLFSFTLKLSLIWCFAQLAGCVLGPTDTVTLEYDGPVTITYSPENSPETTQSFQVSDQTTFTLKNSDGKTLVFLMKDNAAFQMGLGLNIPGYNEVNDPDIVPMVWAQGQPGIYTIQKGAETPISVSAFSLSGSTASGIDFSPISASGANLTKLVVRQAGDDGTINTADDKVTEAKPADLDGILSDQGKNQMQSSGNYGPLTFIVKTTSTGGKDAVSDSGPQPGPAPAPQTAADKGSGCMQLGAGTPNQSDAWAWAVALILCVTTWVLRRRRAFDNR